MTQEIKDYICLCKDEKLTLREIQASIEMKFDVRMSKQNICRFCTQYMERYKNENENALDMINVFLRVGFYNRVGKTELLNGLSSNIVKSYITKYPEMYEEERSKFYNKYCEIFDNNGDVKGELEYKGVKPNEYVLCRLEDERRALSGYYVRLAEERRKLVSDKLEGEKVRK